MASEALEVYGYKVPEIAIRIAGMWKKKIKNAAESFEKEKHNVI